jgi:hypothetical protein
MAPTSDNIDGDDAPQSVAEGILRPSSFFEPIGAERAHKSSDAPSRTGTASIVGSVAMTITSTIVEGVVHTVAHWKVLLLGQAISLVLAAAGKCHRRILCHICKD